jgi:hypothetical protein
MATVYLSAHTEYLRSNWTKLKKQIFKSYQKVAKFHVLLNSESHNCCFIRGVSKNSVNGTRNKQSEDANKLTLLASKIIPILHHTLLVTFIKLLETVSKGLFWNRSQNHCYTFLDCRRESVHEIKEGILCFNVF